MKTNAWIVTLCAAAGLTPGQASSVVAAYRPEINREITVRVAKRGSIEDRVWRIAQRTARELFAEIGVELRYTTTIEAQSDDFVIDLLLTDRAPARVRESVMGAASTDPEMGPAAFVFYDHVARFYPGWHIDDTGVVLGYVIAHELGHILQTRPGHSLDGVMKARWTPEDAQAMLQHRVKFSRNDSEHIHDVLAQRNPLRAGLTVEQ